MGIAVDKNIGRFDQILRIGISVGMIYAGLVNRELIQDEFSSWLLGILGVINLFIAFVRFCPLYAVTGINTYHNSGH